MVRDMWYKFTLTSNPSAYFAIDVSGTNGTLKGAAALYSGGCNNLTLVDDYGYLGFANISWGVSPFPTAGTYYLRIGQDITGTATKMNIIIDPW